MGSASVRVILTAGLFLTTASLHFLSKKVNKACESCRAMEGKGK